MHSGGDAVSGWVIDLGLEKPPLNLNQRMHYMEKSRITKQLRQLAKVKARFLPEMERCSVEMVWYVNTKHRRDVDNPILTLKALCDGLVDAELVPDDTPEYMAKLPVRIEYRKDGVRALKLIVKDIGEES